MKVDILKNIVHRLTKLQIYTSQRWLRQKFLKGLVTSPPNSIEDMMEVNYFVSYFYVWQKERGFTN